MLPDEPIWSRFCSKRLYWEASDDWFFLRTPSECLAHGESNIVTAPVWFSCIISQSLVYIWPYVCWFIYSSSLHGIDILLRDVEPGSTRIFLAPELRGETTIIMLWILAHMMSTYVAPFLTYIVGTATKFCNADGCTRVSHWKFWYLGLDGAIERQLLFFVFFLFYTSFSLLLAFLCLNYGRMVAERRTLLHNERLYSWRMFDRSIALYGLRVSRASLFTLSCHHIPCPIGSAMFLYPSGQTMVAICSSTGRKTNGSGIIVSNIFVF